MRAVGHCWKRFPNKVIEYKYKTASCRIGRSDGINREFMKTNFKQKIIGQARSEGLQVTALREQVLDIVLQQSGVIKAYNVLSQMQQRVYFGLHRMRHGGRANPQPRVGGIARRRCRKRLRAERRTRCFNGDL